MKRTFGTVLTLFLALTLAACAGGGGGGGYPPEVRQGKIEQITPVQLDHPNQLGVGAILGGAAGAGLGSLVGGGTGRDVAIAIGAIAGAVGGSYAQNRFQNRREGQQIVVRLDSGVLVVVTQPADGSLRVGQNVYVEGSGPDAKVLPR